MGLSNVLTDVFVNKTDVGVGSDQKEALLLSLTSVGSRGDPSFVMPSLAIFLKRSSTGTKDSCVSYDSSTFKALNMLGSRQLSQPNGPGRCDWNAK